jgi:hypothetical protein
LTCKHYFQKNLICKHDFSPYIILYCWAVHQTLQLNTVKHLVMNMWRNEQTDFPCLCHKKCEFFPLKPVVIVISQHILGGFHYFTVHGPEQLSWSLLNSEHFSPMLQISGANAIHTLHSITLNNCVKDQAPSHSSDPCYVFWSYIQKQLVCNFIQFIIVHNTNYFPLQSNSIHTSSWKTVILTGFLWVFCPSR